MLLLKMTSYTLAGQGRLPCHQVSTKIWLPRGTFLLFFKQSGIAKTLGGIFPSSQEDKLQSLVY